MRNISVRLADASFALLLFSFLGTFASAQTETATIRGRVTDPAGAVVANALLHLVNIDKGTEMTTRSNSSGIYVIPDVQPGRYRLQAERDGFKVANLVDLTVNVQDNLEENFRLEVGSAAESVTVSGDSNNINTTDGSVSTVIDRQFVENIPLNGRSFQSLVTLSPGVVLTNATANNQGQFSVNGQRANTNYFTVDGVSANAGVSSANVLGQSGSGSLPGFSAAGSTNSLVSVEALQEFKIATSTYAPEFGRQPGAQVSMLTRSGTNDFHGALFEYFRNDALDSTDWFANSARLGKAQLRQNQFGGVLGGPIRRNRTFFFVSYEGLRLRLPKTSIGETPSVSSRTAARPQIQPYLNAYPLPNGPAIIDPVTQQPTGFAQLNAAFSNPSSIDTTSIRLDHTFNSRFFVFGRYSYAPSEAVQRGGVNSTLNTLFVTSSAGQTLTTGATWSLSSRASDDIRFNYSRFEGGSHFTLDNFGGATLPSDSTFLPFATRENALYQFGLLGTGRALQLGKNVENVQRQVNLVDNFSITLGAHQLKSGVDYRRLSPTNGQRKYENFVLFDGLTGPTGAMTGTPIFLSVGARDPVTLLLNNYSAYGQDTWRMNRRLTVTYGVRYEINPAPKGIDGKDLYTVQGLENPASATLAPRGTALYKTTYGNLAPRIGASYLLSERPGWETVLRGGWGIFYDLGTGTAASSASLFPYARSSTLTGVSYPFVDQAQAAPPPFSLSPPVSEINAFESGFKLPRVYQSNVTLEQVLRQKQSLSVAYLAGNGRKLLRQELLQGGTLNPSFTRVDFTGNTATSDYHALQLKAQRKFPQGLQMLASYTWSHSLDNFSTDAVPTPPNELINPQVDRGASDFDVRHTLSAALTYNIPSLQIDRIGSSILRNFSIDGILTARSATPVNIVTGATFLGVPTAIRPDLIPAVPLFIDDPNVAGGRRINRAAFQSPPAALQGTLGRNVLRGFALVQTDFSVRRYFTPKEGVALQFSAEFFNLFNHPNFANPNGNLADTLNFGRSTQLLGSSLGTGGANGGLNPLYQVGGPRSVQLALRLQL